MRKATIILSTIVVWLIVVSAAAYYYIVSILALPEKTDTYALNWEFQLLMFAIFRLPLWVFLLIFFIAAEVSIFNRILKLK